jgi:hypothetical protein
MSRVEKIMLIEPNMSRKMEKRDVDFRTLLEYEQKEEDIRQKEI